MEKFETTGSVKTRCGKHERHVLHADAENLQAVAELVAVNEGTPRSVRNGAAQLGLAPKSYHRALKELGLKCYRPQLVVELSDDDFDMQDITETYNYMHVSAVSISSNLQLITIVCNCACNCLQ